MQKKISITKIKNNLSEAIFKGLEWIDYKNLIPKNSRIVIKPNFTYPAYKQGVTVCPETIEKTVSKGKKVTLVGFGTFEARKRAARTGRNPQTGKEIKIPAKTVPTFTAGKKFRELVNK